MSLDQQALYDARLELVDYLVDALYDTPEAAFVERLLDGGLDTPADSINDDLDAGFEYLHEFVEENEGRDVEAVVDDLAKEFTRVFVGPRPPVQPHETYYREDTDFLSSGLAEVDASYGAAGWKVPESISEEADYVGVELLFLRNLLRRQQAGEEEAVGFERVFLDEHLSTWLDAYLDDVVEATDEPFYLAAVHVLRGFVAFERDLVA
ncbi:TorD/DmsD family molecular chaperone [Halobacterium noricense]|uniref:TorD/DmsD family molecular chaperone n=1 Tax=Halobacterium noricense TaxID=223182 RepID=UPI001E2FFB63|nr:molecular chaperone TorD family protein [Halobacterium noricense]UHH26171.1 molecular chaperone TorD family protein [Halobacterium noricense]